jgi:NAD(P)H dehydrogenase (quinone)
MKAVIVFHSICGNDYLVAKEFYQGLKAGGVDAGLFRVADASWVEKPDLSVKAKEVVHAMRSLPEATSQVLLDADLVIMGSPTYFGNVSAQMKAFMDSTGGLWIHAKLAGKKFVAFTSAGNTEGGGDLCLQALHTYAKYMGMLSVPVPVGTVPGENIPVLGVIHYSNGKYGEELDVKTRRVVDGFCEFLLKVIKG